MMTTFGKLGADAGAPRLGATPLTGERTGFTLWAPNATSVNVVLLDHPGSLSELQPIGRGYHAGIVGDCPVGTRYHLSLNGGPLLADPASRFQPHGVLGPSEVIDLSSHRWSDGAYRARPLHEHVISECHIGTLTKEGTFDAAIKTLDDLVEVGITALELMPVAQFPGARNWGYDGAFPFAVQDSYGGPSSLQRLVEACHRRGLAVVLDVVCNHIGPIGNDLEAFGPYFRTCHSTDWGPAPNFDGPFSEHVRAYFLQAVAQWFVDFHIDVLRLDAIDSIIDSSTNPFVAELCSYCEKLSRKLNRTCSLIAESADNDPMVVTSPTRGGIGMHAQWNDDFHHAVHALLSGERSGYYSDFGAVEDIARSMDQGFVYQGEYSRYRGQRHGAPSVGIEPERFVLYVQNHDQIGNRPFGERLTSLVGLDRQRMAAGLLFFTPGIPLLFMGEEYGETAPFPYFVEHSDPILSEQVRRARARELQSFGFEDSPLNPSKQSTFDCAVIDRAKRHSGRKNSLWMLYHRLIALRHDIPALARSRREEVDVSVCGPAITLTRRHDTGTVVAIFNVGPSEAHPQMPAILTSACPPTGLIWRRLFDSGELEVGGNGLLVPLEIGAGDPVILAPWAFCLYGFGIQLP